MTTNNANNNAITAYACACWISEYVNNQGRIPSETVEAYFAKLDEAKRVELLAADKVEELTGSRPVFLDQGGFIEGHGVVLFEHDGIKYEYNSHRLTVC